MGAHNFHTQVWSAESPDKAYALAVEEALYEYGHDPYNGTISTTNGFSVVTHDLVPAEQEYDVVDAHIDNFDKWGRCGAFKVAGIDGKFSHWAFFGWAAS